MRVTRAALAITTAITLCASSLRAQTIQGSPATTALVPRSGVDSAYLIRLAVVQGGDTTADLSALRRQFAQTTFYDPYSTDAGDRRKRMWMRMNEKDEAGAGLVADSVLAANYLDPDANLISGISAHARGDTVAAARHIAIARGILRSIESTGDGKSSDHPLFVLSPAEEYSYLGAIGLERVGMQSLIKCAGGRPCDLLEVAPIRGGDKFDMFFDVSLPMAYLDKQFKAK